MAVRFNFTVLLGLLKECRLEFDYNYFHYKDYKHLINTLTDLLGHLSSMASCIRIKSAKNEPILNDQSLKSTDQPIEDYFSTQDTISGLKEMLSLTNTLKEIKAHLQVREQEKSYIRDIKNQIEEILKESCSMLIKLSYIFNQDPSKRRAEDDESLFSDIGTNWEEIQIHQKKMVSNLFSNNAFFDSDKIFGDMSKCSIDSLTDIETSNFLMNFLFM